MDTAAGVWLDRNGLVTSSRTSKDHSQYDPALELMRRCRHAAAAIGVRIYVYGGLRGGKEFNTEESSKGSYIIPSSFNDMVIGSLMVF